MCSVLKFFSADDKGSGTPMRVLRRDLLAQELQVCGGDLYKTEVSGPLQRVP